MHFASHYFLDYYFLPTPSKVKPFGATFFTFTMSSEEQSPDLIEASNPQNNNKNELLVSVQESNTARTTPKSPRFVFLSEEKQVPEQLHNLQEISLRRRDEFQTNIHDLELRVAALTARLAEERMDRENSLQDVLLHDVFKPLEADQLQLDKESESLSATSSWVRLEGRLSALDTRMTHSLHVNLEDSLREQLEDLLAKLEYQIIPDMQVEVYKADKREGSLFRRFEELVGSMARRYHEERAGLQAAIARTCQQIVAMEDLDQVKGEIFLEKIGKVRERLEEERAKRRAEDARILQLIEQRGSLLKEALLETVGSDLSWEMSLSNLAISDLKEDANDGKEVLPE